MNKLVEEDLAEVIPSKLVFTVKPDQSQKAGKKKTRWSPVATIKTAKGHKTCVLVEQQLRRSEKL